MAKSRCRNQRLPSWPNYGGRGIEFRFNSFDEFYNHIGPRPVGYTLDRIDNNGHYEIGNIRWATRSEQNLNKRLYRTSLTGIKDICVRQPSGKYKTTRYVVRVYIDGKRTYIYSGPSFTKALEAYEKQTRF